MREEAADAGRYKANLLADTKSYPKIQILTVESLINKTQRVDAPPQANPFAKAQCEGIREKQPDLVYACEVHNPANGLPYLHKSNNTV